MFNIVLVEPEIPPNTGNIARTCALTGVKLHLIRPLGFSLDEKAVKRAGLDYWHLLDLEVHDDLESFLKKYGERDIYLATTKGAKVYSSVSFSPDSFIVFGAETRGLPDMLHDLYLDNRVKIPMYKHEDVRSLNLSNSVAIILFEALRQNGFNNLL